MPFLLAKQILNQIFFIVNVIFAARNSTSRKRETDSGKSAQIIAGNKKEKYTMRVLGSRKRQEGKQKE